MYDTRAIETAAAGMSRAVLSPVAAAPARRQSSPPAPALRVPRERIRYDKLTAELEQARAVDRARARRRAPAPAGRPRRAVDVIAEQGAGGPFPTEVVALARTLAGQNGRRGPRPSPAYDNVVRNYTGAVTVR